MFYELIYINKNSYGFCCLKTTMSKTIKEQMTSMISKSNVKNQNVKVSYKSVNAHDKDSRNETLIAMEKKILDAKKMNLLEKEVENLKFHLSQQADTLASARRACMLLEQENSKLRGAKSSGVEKREKSSTQSVLKSKEYQALLTQNKELDSKMVSVGNELTEIKKNNKDLCIEVARILKKLLKEVSLKKAMREKHERNIKTIEDGDLSAISYVISGLSYEINSD